LHPYGHTAEWCRLLCSNLSTKISALPHSSISAFPSHCMWLRGKPRSRPQDQRTAVPNRDSGFSHSQTGLVQNNHVHETHSHSPTPASIGKIERKKPRRWLKLDLDSLSQRERQPADPHLESTYIMSLTKLLHSASVAISGGHIKNLLACVWACGDSNVAQTNSSQPWHLCKHAVSWLC